MHKIVVKNPINEPLDNSNVLAFILLDYRCEEDLEEHR